MKKLITLAILAAAFSLTASATLVSFSANVSFDPTGGIADYTADAFDVDDTAFVWTEKEGFENDSAFDTDHTLVGKAAPVAGVGPAIPVGTSLNSYLMYYDPAGNVPKPQTVTLTFSTPIIGVVFTGGNLLASDHLRVLAAPYAGSFSLRGGEATDFITISADGKTLTYEGRASTPGDQLRIITAGVIGEVPEPATMAMVGGACILLALVGRRRRA